MKKILLVGAAVVAVGAGGASKIATAGTTASSSEVSVVLNGDGSPVQGQSSDSNWAAMKINDGTTNPSDDIDELPAPQQLQAPGYSAAEETEMRTGLGQFTYGLNYDSMVPLYVESCSFSQWDRRPDDKGGSGGHAAIYLKGTELDPAYAGKYPRLRLKPALENATSLDDIRAMAADPDWGSSASVDKTFRNANWVSMPSKSLFLRGIPNYTDDGQRLPKADCNLQPTEVPGKHTLFGGKIAGGVEYECKVTPGAGDALDKTLDAAYPFFRDIVVSAPERKALIAEFPDAAQGGDAMARAIANDAIGTDFAVTFAREAYCIRVPMGREGIRGVMNYLNKRNDDAYAAFVKGGASTHPDKTMVDDGNVWDGINNNCTHMTHNAIAATGERLPIASFNGVRFRGMGREIFDVATLLPVMIFQIATPANDFISLALMTNDAKLSHGDYRWTNHSEMDPEKIYRNAKLRTMVDDPIQGWLPMQPGSLVEPIYQIPQGDAAKDPDPRHWQNQIFVPHPNTMLLFDVATIPSFIPKIGTFLADLIRKTPVAPRAKQLDYIMSTDEKNPYTHPIAHIDYFQDVYQSLSKDYCSGEGSAAKRAAADAEFNAFLGHYCSLVARRVELMTTYRPQILASERHSADAALAANVGPTRDARTGRLSNLK